MGLLDKTLKKLGHPRPEKSTEKSVDSAPEKSELPEKMPVGWVNRSLGERASALTDKIDLEEQYDRLGALAANQGEMHKPSLRERARRLLDRLVPHTVAHDSENVARKETQPKKSLRERAFSLLRKDRGTGGGGAGSGGSTPHSGEQGGSAETTQGQSLEAQEAEHEGFDLPHGEDVPYFPPFPSMVFDEEDTPVPSVFGEPELETSREESAAETAEPKSSLEEFSDTVGLLTQNLKSLHEQLDKGPLIAKPSERLELGGREPLRNIRSHHVPISSGETTESTTASRPLERAEDVFWPRALALDIPTRDIRWNADGSVSVVPGPFKLPHLVDSIAAAESELSHFRQNLKNAELFIAEGEIQLAKIIYERLLQKIFDKEAKKKICENLEALENYKKSHDWGNFMPLPPWMNPAFQNPWQNYQPPQLNVSEMPVEAKSITINIDKGIFDVARAAFEAEQKEKKTTPSEEDAAGAGAGDSDGEGDADVDSDGDGDSDGKENERRAEDRRQGGADTRGEGAPDRRSGRDRRLEENTAPPALDAAGESADASGGADAAGGAGEGAPPADGVMEKPQIPNMSPDGSAMAAGEGDDGGGNEDKPEDNKVQEIRGVLELKTPDQEDTPFLTLTYDFTKIPYAYRLAKDNGIFEYAYYKYKPMLVKAHQFIKRKQITRALNYYRVIREQQIPSEFRHMVDRNIKDITEYLQKYLVTRQN